MNDTLSLKEEKVKKKKKKEFQYRDANQGYAMVAPAFILLLVFAYIPLIMALFRAFQDYSTGEFCGFNNFDYILKTPAFIKSFGNVLLFTAIIVVAQMVLSFFFASVLKAIDIKVANAIKVICYVPCLISGVVASIMYMFILNYGGGLITSILVSLDKDPIAFTTQGYWPILCVLLPTFWLGFGYNTLVMYAGLLNVPKTYYEVAEIDGANFWEKNRFITLPYMKNIFILVLVNLITGTLQMMDIPYMITGGGPLEMTLTPSLYLFNSFRDTGRPQNVTIAGALLVMILIVTVNIVAFKFIKSEKMEE